MYKIQCEVSGGVTGYRCAYYKEAGREMVWRDDQYRDAEDKARELAAKAHANQYRTADFKYTVVNV